MGVARAGLHSGRLLRILSMMSNNMWEQEEIMRGLGMKIVWGILATLICLSFIIEFLPRG